MKIECYEMRYVVCNKEYFGGGWGDAGEFKAECFATEEEATKARDEKKKEVAERMAWCKWWIEEYIKDEYFTVEKVVKTF